MPRNSFRREGRLCAFNSTSNHRGLLDKEAGPAHKFSLLHHFYRLSCWPHQRHLLVLPNSGQVTSLGGGSSLSVEQNQKEKRTKCNSNPDCKAVQTVQKCCVSDMVTFTLLSVNPGSRPWLQKLGASVGRVAGSMFKNASVTETNADREQTHFWWSFCSLLSFIQHI